VNKCPSDIKIGLLLEGSLSKSEAVDVYRHIAQCQECACVFATELECLDMVSENLFEDLTDEEITCSTTALRALFKQK
jgi:hypothetical protein